MRHFPHLFDEDGLTPTELLDPELRTAMRPQSEELGLRSLLEYTPRSVRRGAIIRSLSRRYRAERDDAA